MHMKYEPFTEIKHLTELYSIWSPSAGERGTCECHGEAIEQVTYRKQPILKCYPCRIMMDHLQW